MSLTSVKYRIRRPAVMAFLATFAAASPALAVITPAPAVPEPTGAALFALGAALVVGASRLRKR